MFGVKPQMPDQLDPFYNTTIGRLPPTGIWDSSPVSMCIQRSVISGLFGYPMGMVIAFLFPSSFAPDTRKMSTKESIRIFFKNSWDQGRSQGRTFAKFGFLLVSSECALELITGKSTLTNTGVAGFFSGAAMAARAGPAGMSMAGFGGMALILAMEVVMGLKNAK